MGGSPSTTCSRLSTRRPTTTRLVSSTWVAAPCRSSTRRARMSPRAPSGRRSTLVAARTRFTSSRILASGSTRRARRCSPRSSSDGAGPGRWLTHACRGARRKRTRGLSSSAKAIGRAARGLSVAYSRMALPRDSHHLRIASMAFRTCTTAQRPSASSIPSRASSARSTRRLRPSPPLASRFALSTLPPTRRDSPTHRTPPSRTTTAAMLPTWPSSSARLALASRHPLP
mmetsp:Transcript_17845/g.53852  ORF Transcript_17845/g.53852 Transcript_17845/m.53852 type:complete len:229 (-) Transcript_17845:1076-1762(-)